MMIKMTIGTVVEMKHTMFVLLSLRVIRFVCFVFQNQTFHYTRRITLKRVTSLCPSLRHSAKATQLLA